MRKRLALLATLLTTLGLILWVPAPVGANGYVVEYSWDCPVPAYDCNSCCWPITGDWNGEWDCMDVCATYTDGCSGVQKYVRDYYRYEPIYDPATGYYYWGWVDYRYTIWVSPSC